MPYDPKTGEWKDEDTNVSTRLTGLLAQDSDYLKSAGTEARKASNRRGLLNSSINTEAVESARIKAALPIASQEASQASARNLLGRQLQTADLQQQRDITSREGMQQTEIRHQENLQLQDIAARSNLQAEQLAHLDAAQLRDIAAREGLQEAELQALVDRQQMDIQNQQFMQSLDLETRQLMQGLDIESQNRIANLNVAASERNAAAALAASLERNYSEMLASIMSNPDIRSRDRQTYIDHANTIRESNLRLIEQMYGIELQWESGALWPGAPGGPGGPPPESIPDEGAQIQ